MSGWAPTRLHPVAAQTVDKGAVSVPVAPREGLDQLRIDPAPGALRYQVRLDERANLDALLVTKDPQTLVVVFHGMMVPGHHFLPRFEWLRTLQATDYSCLYLSDPTLQADETLRLGWYIGWQDLDLVPLLAQVISAGGEALGAQRIVLIGSSGGGFASLQVSSYLPGSVAVAFNAQTDIGRYRWDAQVAFARRVMPQLLPSGKGRKQWARSLGQRSSVLRRYESARQNHVLCIQNVNDTFHLTRHHQPFQELMESSPNRNRSHFELYDGPSAHEPPGRARFLDAIGRAEQILTDGPIGLISS